MSFLTRLISSARIILLPTVDSVQHCLNIDVATVGICRSVVTHQSHFKICLLKTLLKYLFYCSRPRGVVDRGTGCYIDGTGFESQKKAWT